MGLAGRSGVRLNLAMSARRVVSRSVCASEIVAFVVAMTSFVCWLVAVEKLGFLFDERRKGVNHWGQPGRPILVARF